jgi:outer membrane protein assembly factor BamA
MIAPRSSKPESKDSRLGAGLKLDISGLNDYGLRAVGLGMGLTLKNVPTSTSNVTLAGSWSGVDRRRVKLGGVIGEHRPMTLRLEAEYDYKPNRRYFGIGNHSERERRGYFLLEETNAEAILSFGSSYERQLGLVAGYSHMSPRHGYHGSPALEDLFTAETAPFMFQDTREMVYGVTANLAAVDDRKQPSRGVHGRAEFRHATGVRDQDPDYHQWHVEARGYVPVFATRRVLVVRGAYAGVDPSGGTTIMPFYRLAQSEQALRFAGYSSQRFRDRRLALARLEYRWMIHRHLSALVLYELGEVAPHTRSFTARDVHVSYGGGVRFATSETKMVRVEAARSIEGTHFALHVGRDF